ncbi:MAG: Holliday junction resolvase RuvX [Candidatus Brocadiia bacterium]
MIILGLDYGEQRIGVAVCDELEVAAHPLPTIERDGAELEAIRRIAEERGVDQILVGLPLRTDGSEGPEARRVRGFIKELRAELPQVEVLTQDERFSSTQAHQALSRMGASRRQRRESVDGMAAQIILQRHLEKRRRQRRQGSDGEAT